MIFIARVYDPEVKEGGTLYLVERLWPRGMKKEALRLDGWLKDVAPSAALRRWFDHKPERWKEFQKRYTSELRANPEGWETILKIARRGNVTLLYSARDTDHNSAVVLRAFIAARLGRHAVGKKRSLLAWPLTLFVCLAARASFAFNETKSLNIGGSTITVRIEPQPSPLPLDTVMAWVQRAAQAVTSYYGRFPVPTVQLTIHTDKGGQIGHGVTYSGRRIEINLGRRTNSQNLIEDWEMTHEMLHLSFPLLDDDYNWMGEGLSDYVEPIARARLGQEPQEEVWRELVVGLPKGLPQPGDKGLDHTPTWGRIYWGGALYWFLADLQIRRTTQNRRSIRDALRAILDAGGDGRQEWDLEQVLQIGDRATGTHVLTALHDQMGPTPYTPDLNALWQQLGVRYFDGRVSFDDQAPEAALRRSITAP